MITLSGPFRSPLSGKQAKQLVVFLHGVGADGSDLIELAPEFAKSLPDAAFVAPDAPFNCDLAPYGRQWFSLQDRTPTALAQGARRAAPLLNAFLDQQLAHWGLGVADLVVVGFSQGTMMALQVIPRREKACAALVGLSGALVDEASLKTEMGAKTPVFLCHGDADLVVDPACMAHAAQTLRSVGLEVRTLMRPGMGHEIDQTALQAAIGFVANAIFKEASC